MNLFYNWQLQIITYIQNSPISYLEKFFNFLSLLDKTDFYLLMIIILWKGINKKWGIRIFYLFIISMISIIFIKNFLKQPRPLDLLPSISKIATGGYGFPSGAAFLSALFGAIAIYATKKKVVTIISCFYIFLISFSRIYLGIHFLSDILGGWILGFLYAYVFNKTIPYINKRNLLLSLNTLLIINFCVGFILLFLQIKSIFSAIYLGTSLGLFFESKEEFYIQDPHSNFQRLIRSFIAILSTIFLYVLLEKTFYFLSPKTRSFIQYFSIAFWTSYLINYLFLFLVGKRILIKKTFL